MTAVLTCSSCSADLSLSGEVQIDCRQGAPCPEGFVCNLIVGRCISVRGAAEPPEVVSARVTPALAGPKGEVTVSFEVTESLGLPPVVTLGGPDGGRLALVEEHGLAWVFRYLPSGAEPQAVAVSVTATLVDAAGNVTNDAALGAVRFDFEAPSVSRMEVVGGAHLARESLGAVTFTVSEELREVPRVVLAGIGAELAHDPGVEPPGYRFTYAVGPDAPPGWHGVTASVVDVAGNPAEATTPGVFRLDFERPALAAPPELTAEAGRPGTTLGVRFRVSEELGADPAVALVAGGGRLPLVRNERVGLDYFYSLEVPAVEDRSWDLVVDGAADLAGNGLVAWRGEGAFETDSLRPGLSNGMHFDKQPPHYREGESVRVGFSVTEDLGGEAPLVSLDTLEPRALPCEPGEGTSWSCTLDRPLDGGELPWGAVGVSVELRDSAGNTTSASEVVQLDFVPPALARDATLSRCDGRRQARVAANRLWLRLRPDCEEGALPLEVAFSVDEETALGAAPSVTVEGRRLTHLRGEPGGTHFVYGYAPTGEETPTDSTGPQGPGQAVQVELEDLAGNPATHELGRVWFDFVAPASVTTEAGLAGITFHRDPWGSHDSDYVPRMRLTVRPGTFGEPGEVRAWAVTAGAPPEEDPLAGRAELGSGDYSPGEGATIELGVTDRPVVHVTFLDPSGNESDSDPLREGIQPLPVADVALVATLNGKAMGDVLANPHLLLEGATDTAGGISADVETREVREAASYLGAARLRDGLLAVAGGSLSPWRVRSAAVDAGGPPLLVPAVTWDGRRGRALAFAGADLFGQGTGETWEWSPAGWVRRAPATAPPPRQGHAVAWDAAAARVVVFGGVVRSGDGCDGNGEQFCTGTWEWDGADWTRRRSASDPAGGAYAALAYDRARGSLLLFGGYREVPPDDAEYSDETWERREGVWEQRHPAHAPPPRARHALGADAARGTVLLFGGLHPQGGKLADTWEWDGDDWQQRHPGTVPPGRDRHSMVWDPGRERVVLFGGRASEGVACGWYEDEDCSDTWEWDGDDWQQVGPSGVEHVAYGSLAFDADEGRVLLFGTKSGEGEAWLEVLEWDGTAWLTLSPAGATPARRKLPALAHDARRERTVLFGGNAASASVCGFPLSTLCRDTWEWDGSTWARLRPGTIPPARFGPGVAYDARRGVVVVSGGCGAGGSYASCDELLDDTWVWDGESWEARGSGPPARAFHALAWDAARETVVLFGGLGEAAGACGEEDSALCSDTWEWDGEIWRRRDVAEHPPARQLHGMAWDGGRGRVLLFGGYARGEDLGDTWEWDGDAWLRRDPPRSPQPRRATAVVWDAARARVVLAGGFGVGHYQDTWEWDGETWTALAPLVSASGRDEHAMAYEASRGQALLFGGIGDTGVEPCVAREAVGLAGAGYCVHTWGYAPHQATPHLVAAFDLRSPSTIEPSRVDPSTKTLLDVGVRARAGGIGHTWGSGNADGEPVPGHALSVGAFGRGGWLSLLTSDAPADALEEWMGSFGRDWACGEPWCREHRYRPLADGRRPALPRPVAPRLAGRLGGGGPDRPGLRRATGPLLAHRLPGAGRGQPRGHPGRDAVSRREARDGWRDLPGLRVPGALTSAARTVHPPPHSLTSMERS